MPKTNALWKSAIMYRESFDSSVDKMTRSVEVQINQNGNNKQLVSESKRKLSKYIPRMVPEKIFDKVCMVLAEVLGTAALVFFGCMSNVPINGSVLAIASPITFGLTVMMIIQMFGHVSYAILNPAVAIIAVVYDMISVKMAIMFTVAEIVGAILGYGLLQFLSPADLFENANGVCMTLPHADISVTKAFFIEFFLTSALTTLICGAWDPRNKKNTDSTPLRIGLAIIALSICGGPYTGASMNPARTVGPALWNWNWDHQWIYWVAPPLGALVTSVFYKIIFWRDATSDDKTEQRPLVEITRKVDSEM